MKHYEVELKAKVDEDTFERCKKIFVGNKCYLTSKDDTYYKIGDKSIRCRNILTEDCDTNGLKVSSLEITQKVKKYLKTPKNRSTEFNIEDTITYYDPIAINDFKTLFEQFLNAEIEAKKTKKSLVYFLQSTDKEDPLANVVNVEFNQVESKNKILGYFIEIEICFMYSPDPTLVSEDTNVALKEIDRLFDQMGLTEDCVCNKGYVDEIKEIENAEK
jgi:hypothetical protein